MKGGKKVVKKKREKEVKGVTDANDRNRSGRFDQKKCESKPREK